MRALIIGYSNIVQRRVLPALLRAGACQAIDIASQRPQSPSIVAESHRGRIFSSYEQALRESEADFVYVSTVNGTHAQWSRAALLAGKHVIVDKPAVSSPAEAEALAELAAERGLCLAEAVVFSFHPQVAALLQLFREHGSAPTQVVMAFSVPPFAPGNHRYDRAAGGGALWDLGPYAVSLGRVLFGEEPEWLQGAVHSFTEKGDVDTSFSMMAAYPGGKAVVGHFGFESEYENSVLVLGRGVAARVERFFSSAPDAAAEIRYRSKNQPGSIDVPAADTFALFLEQVLSSIARGDFSQWSRPLVQDARALSVLRREAGADMRAE